MTITDEPEAFDDLEGVYTPRQLASELGIARHNVVDAINGRGAFPRKLYAQKVGQYWLIPDAHAHVFAHWIRCRELLEEPPVPMPKLYWTTAELATAAGLAKDTLTKAVAGRQKGRYNYPSSLPGSKVGRYWLIKAEIAEQYLKERRPGQTDGEGS